MAKRVFSAVNQTWTPQTTNAALTSATYMGIAGSATTQVIDVLEVCISGMNTSSAVGAFTFLPNSTVATTPTALASPNADGFMNAYSSPLTGSVVTWVAATGGQFASNVATLAKLNLGLNMFGGIFRWSAAPTQQITIQGNGVSTGSWTLFNSSLAGGASGLANAHIIYEPY